MYGLAGERRLTEHVLPWLPGYEDSAPVRIGNLAHRQLQLDVFGEVMDALHHARRGGLQTRDEDWAFQRALLRYLGKVWDQPDEGIWEMRGPPQHFTFSKIMAWVAVDRGIRAIEKYGLEGPVNEWRDLREQIQASVCTHGFDAGLGSFVQAYGASRLDASLLLIPSMGFLPASDPRVQGTIRAIERQLLVDGYVLRYDTGTTDDGLPPGEGVFLACSFWLVDAFVLSGRIDEAVRLFERLLTLRNDLGLLAEEYDPQTRRLVGNFPQALSHIALVNSAHNLARSTKPAEQRSTG
jgi:GH15 family glucan-1,4-alpha-glucosidase